MLKRIKLTILVVWAMLLVMLPAAPVFAHLMLIEPVEEGKIQVVFDDGTTCRHSEVVVYDENEQEIKQGEVDEKGKFSYPPEDAELIVADDGFGHRAEYVVGEDPHQALPRGPTIAVVLAGFVLVAVIFQYRVKKKKAQV